MKVCRTKFEGFSFVDGMVMLEIGHAETVRPNVPYLPEKIWLNSLIMSSDPCGQQNYHFIVRLEQKRRVGFHAQRIKFIDR